MADEQQTQDNTDQDQASQADQNIDEQATEIVPEAEVKSTKVKPDFGVGDKVVVNYRIVEGSKSRVQPYEGIVIGIKGSGVSKTFTVRRMAAANVGVERIFPLKSPNIESVSVKARGKVRRAKLYYLRERTGKAASQIKER